MTGAVRVAIVDDEDEPRARLASHLRRYTQEHGVPFDVTEFPSGSALINPYRADFDVIFLDVQMPGADGFETAHHIRSLDSETVIIFVTNMVHQAIRGYEVDALNYIIKPVRYFPLSQEIRRSLLRLRETETPTLMLTTASDVARVEITSVVHVESDKHRITVHAMDRMHTVTGTLKSFEEQLSEHGFYRCNNSYLVNLDHVIGVQGNQCLMRTGAELQISRPRRRGFLEALTEHMKDAVR